jgi:DinB superfamily
MANANIMPSLSSMESVVAPGGSGGWPPSDLPPVKERCRPRGDRWRTGLGRPAIERLWAQATERAGRLPAAALDQQVNKEWSFAQTLRHLVFITDAWASRTVLDEEMPYHPLGLPQSWYPPADAAALGIDLAAQPSYQDILAARADRMDVMRRIVADLTDADLGRLCQRSPAPGYPDEERTVIDCIAVVMDEEIEHYRFAVRDLAVLEAS